MNAWLLLLAVIISVVVSLSANVSIEKVQNLDLGRHFKPRRKRRAKKCSKCGRKISEDERYGCDVDYHGKTDWYCEECNINAWSDAPYEAPCND